MKRNINQYFSKMGKGKKGFCAILLAIMMWSIVLSLPGTIYFAKTYMIGWEIARNSNLTYRLGEPLKEKRLSEEFEKIGGKEWTMFESYILKHETATVREAWAEGFPYRLLSARRVVKINTSKSNFEVYGICPGMEMEQAEMKLLERGYKRVDDRSHITLESGRMVYMKWGTVQIEITKEGGVVEDMSIYVDDLLE